MELQSRDTNMMQDVIDAQYVYITMLILNIPIQRSNDLVIPRSLIQAMYDMHSKKITELDFIMKAGAAFNDETEDGVPLHLPNVLH